MGSKKQKTQRRSYDSAVPLKVQRARLRGIKRDFLIGVILTLALITGKDLFEKTRYGGYLEDLARDWLEYRLAINRDGRPTKIVVVDISNFSPVAKHPYTSRTALRQLIDAVSTRPLRSIGLDVNFSAENGEPFFVPDEDPTFFNYCLKKKKEIKNGLLFVGISNSVVRGPERALGSIEYLPLAAYIDHPNSEGFGASAEMDESIEVPYISDKGGTLYQSYRSLAAALANQQNAKESWLTKWIEYTHLVPYPVQETATDSFNIRHRRFVVDFSRIDDLETGAILAPADPKDLTSLKTDNRLGGNVNVLIGRGENADDSDRFAVPGHTKHYPGVFLHACALYTLLAKENRLRLMTTWGRRWFDAVVSFFIFFPILVLRWYYNSRKDEVAAHRLNKILTWFAIVVLFVVGVWMVNRTRIFWEDFPLVMVALLLHSRLEHHAETLAPGLVRRLRSAWHAIVLTRHTSGNE